MISSTTGSLRLWSSACRNAERVFTTLEQQPRASLSCVLFEPLAGFAESVEFADQVGSGAANRCFAEAHARIDYQ